PAYSVRRRQAVRHRHRVCRGRSRRVYAASDYQRSGRERLIATKGSRPQPPRSLLPKIKGCAMFHAECDIAAVVYDADQDPDAVLRDFAADLNEHGYRA